MAVIAGLKAIFVVVSAEIYGFFNSAVTKQIETVFSTVKRFKDILRVHLCREQMRSGVTKVNRLPHKVRFKLFRYIFSVYKPHSVPLLYAVFVNS